MKNLINIFTIIIFFAVSAQAQGQKEEPPKKEKEKIEFVSLNDLVDYLEAVKKGEVEPIDKVTLEKEYARLISEMDQEFHSGSPNKQSNPTKPVITTGVADENVGDIK